MTENKTASIMRLKPKAQDEEQKATTWRLASEVVKHVDVVFTSQASLCRYLDTNPKTWRDLTIGRGVREATAKAVAINFALFVDGVAEGRIEPDRGAFRETFAKKLQEIYAPYIISYDFSALIEAVA